MPSSSDLSAERRSAARKGLTVEVTMESDSHFFTGLSGDLSRGGVFIATYQRLSVGDDVYLHFVLPSGEVRVRGRVRWSREASGDRGPGFGVSFEDIPDEAKKAIEAFCDERPPLFYEVGDRPSRT